METDNASVHNQLSKTQKDVNQRLAEIEMQIHEEEFSFDGNPSPKSSEEEEENNRESFIWTKIIYDYDIYIFKRRGLGNYTYYSQMKKLLTNIAPKNCFYEAQKLCSLCTRTPQKLVHSCKINCPQTFI